MSDELRDDEYTPSMKRIRLEYMAMSEDSYGDPDLPLLEMKFDRALEVEVERRVAEATAEAWDEGERHESEYLRMFGQFCHNPQNPYRAASIETGGEK